MKFKVSEIFGPTFQGEGPEIGLMTYFIRFGGCDYRCIWCDSMHAVDPAQVKELPELSTLEIAEDLFEVSGQTSHRQKNHVVLSGGNPLIWDLEELCALLKARSWKISVETQGTIYRDWLRLCDTIIVSPKPPSSGMRFSEKRFTHFVSQVRKHLYANMHLKIVIFDEQDIRWALALAEDIDAPQVYLSIGTNRNDSRDDIMLRYQTLTQAVFDQKPNMSVFILPQLHVVQYGHKLGV